MTKNFSSKKIRDYFSVEVNSSGLKPIAALVWSAFVVAGSAHAADIQKSDTANASSAVTFDSTFLRTDPAQTVDVARFARSNPVSPGVYSVDIWVNDTRVAHDDVRFIAAAKDESARPCFSRKTLQGFGVDFAKAAADTGARHDADGASAVSADECVDLAAAVPGATVEFDFSEQKVHLAVPQKYMRNSARGYVPPEMWEQGVNAGFLS